MGKGHARNEDTKLNSGSVEVDSDNCIKFAKDVYFISEIDNGNSGANKTINWKEGNKQKITLTAICALTFTAPTGACSISLKVIQGGTGSYTLSYPVTVKWANATPPILSTAVGAIDIISLYFDGTNYFGIASLNFV